MPSEPARFENLVASHLLKWVHFEQDAKGRDVELRYFRDTDGREVDFVVVEGRRPLLLVEAKWGDPSGPEPALPQGPVPEADAWQISATGTEGLRDPRGDPGRAGPGASSGRSSDGGWGQILNLDSRFKI